MCPDQCVTYLWRLYPRTVEFFSNNFGIQYISFDGEATDVTLHKVREALDAIYGGVEEREAMEDVDDRTQIKLVAQQSVQGDVPASRARPLT
jgi:hypothetical protein